MSENINLFHVLVVGPFLGYIAYQNIQLQPIPPAVYYVLLVLVIVMMIYHVYRYAEKTSLLESKPAALPVVSTTVGSTAGPSNTVAPSTLAPTVLAPTALAPTTVEVPTTTSSTVVEATLQDAANKVEGFMRRCIQKSS